MLCSSSLPVRNLAPYWKSRLPPAPPAPKHLGFTTSVASFIHHLAKNPFSFPSVLPSPRLTSTSLSYVTKLAFQLSQIRFRLPPSRNQFQNRKTVISQALGFRASMALNVLAGSSVTRATLFLSGDSSAHLQRQARSPSLSFPRSCRSTTVRSSRLPLNPREAKEMAEGREPEKLNEGGGAGPNPFRFFQNFKDSLFQDHKRLQKEKNLPKGDILYTVEKGDTLYKISDRHGTSLELLMEANGIEDPHNLSIGQEIWIPRTYQIKKGDTLYSISKQFGINMEAIQESNGIDDPNFIHEGDHIYLPENPSSPTE